MKERFLIRLGLGLSILGLGFFTNQGLSSSAPQKPVALKSCLAVGCHSPSPSELRGNLVSVSMKAGLIQINTGVNWQVKFDENTKVVGWAQPLSKLGRGAPINIVYTQKNGELYATLVSVKPPLSVPQDKLVVVDEIKKIWEEKKALIVDARPAPKYLEEHIPGAINIPFIEMDKHLDKLPADKNALIVTYCEGRR